MTHSTGIYIVSVMTHMMCLMLCRLVFGGYNEAHRSDGGRAISGVYRLSLDNSIVSSNIFEAHVLLMIDVHCCSPRPRCAPMDDSFVLPPLHHHDRPNNYA